ncbi:hypothetical protein FRB94_003196 [Tulasnella sp. JGI-2019a]|nr:hypothetical protein FRB94_003196 [Tulasnella sp. JGI-2019a]
MQTSMLQLGRNHLVSFLNQISFGYLRLPYPIPIVEESVDEGPTITRHQIHTNYPVIWNLGEDLNLYTLNIGKQYGEVADEWVDIGLSDVQRQKGEIDEGS